MGLSKRELKGLKLLIEQNGVRELEPGKFVVRSQRDKNKWYEVVCENGKLKCTCEDYRRRKRPCKHIYAVRYYLMIRELSHKLREEVHSEDEVCPYCGSAHVVKCGYRYNKSGPVQRYLCKTCGRRFVNRYGLEGLRFSPDIIVTAIDLYCRGLSLRQVAEHLRRARGIRVSHATVYNWIKRFARLIHEYTKHVRADVADRWCADETIVRINGRDAILWSLLDSETRFLLAVRISASRKAEEARKLLKEGLKRANKRPLEIITDGNKAYEKAINEEFGGNGSNLIHVQALLSGPLTNNYVESLFSVIKSRLRTMKRFYSMETARTFVALYEFFHNFMKEHSALKQTPAEFIGLTDENTTWLSILRKVRKKRCNKGASSKREASEV